MLAVLHLQRSDVTTLIEEFHYPRLGPGQMWERMPDAVSRRRRGPGCSSTDRATSIRHEHDIVSEVTVESDGREIDVPVDAVLSSHARCSELILRLDPAPPAEVVEAARRPALPRLPRSRS